MTNGRGCKSGCTRADARADTRELSLVDREQMQEWMRERMRERIHESCDWFRQITCLSVCLSEPMRALVHLLPHPLLKINKFLTFDSNSTSDRSLSDVLKKECTPYGLLFDMSQPINPSTNKKFEKKV